MIVYIGVSVYYSFSLWFDWMPFGLLMLNPLCYLYLFSSVFFHAIFLTVISFVSLESKCFMTGICINFSVYVFYRVLDGYTCTCNTLFNYIWWTDWEISMCKSYLSLNDTSTGSLFSCMNCRVVNQFCLEMIRYLKNEWIPGQLSLTC